MLKYLENPQRFRLGLFLLFTNYNADLMTFL